MTTREVFSSACSGGKSASAQHHLAVTLSTLLLMAIAAAGLLRLEWHKTGWILLVVTATIFVAIGWGLLPSLLLTGLQAGYISDPPDHWDARSTIVLLGGGTDRVDDTRDVEVAAIAYGRVVKTAELYRLCQQHGGDCAVLVSGGDAQGQGMSEASVYTAQLVLLGVTASDLVLESRSMNTWQNAQFSARILKARPASQVLLVSSGIHMRRSLLYFSHFGISAAPIRADYERAIATPIPLSFNFALTDLSLHEYSGILRYYLCQRLGWNIDSAHPGEP